MRWLFWLTAILLTGVFAFNAVLYGIRERALRQLPDCEAVDPMGWLDALWWFLNECLATALVVGLAPIGGWLARPTSAHRNALGKGPVILVHGWGLNAACFYLLRRRLQRDGWGPVVGFNYRSWNADIEGAAAKLRPLVEATGREATRPVTLIGHSMGGLVIRYLVRRFPARGVRRIVTLGTPHQGTWLASSVLPKLAPQSPFLANLNAADRTTRQLDAIAIYSTFDAVVLPPTSGAYEGAFCIQVDNVGHNALLTSRRIYGLIQENLEAPLR